MTTSADRVGDLDGDLAHGSAGGRHEHGCASLVLGLGTRLYRGKRSDQNCPHWRRPANTTDRPVRQQRCARGAVLGLGLALKPQRDAVDAGVEDAHDGERDPEVAELQQRAEDGLLEVLYVAAGFLVAPKKTSESRH